MSFTEEHWKAVYDLARWKGIEIEYFDVHGHPHRLAPETVLTFLSAMGCPTETLERVNQEIQREKDRKEAGVTPRTLVVSEGRQPENLILEIPGDPFGRESDGSFPPFRVLMTVQVEGQGQILYPVPQGTWTVRQSKAPVRIALPFPGPLPLGYHRIYVFLRRGNDWEEQGFHVIVCPEQAFIPPVLDGAGKRAGLMVWLAGLRSQHNWGIGDLGDLKVLVPWAVERLHVSLIGLLPLHALANREPFNISPYYPSSRFYRNPIYLDVPALEDFRQTPEMQSLLNREDFRLLLEEYRGSQWIRYEQVDRLKKKVLRQVFETFLQNHWLSPAPSNPRRKEFVDYILREGEGLDRFAVFCALEDFFEKQGPERRTWNHWPEPFQDPGSPEVERFKEEHGLEVLFHKYLQWQLERQLSEVQALAQELGAEIGLYHDLALGFDPLGADAWAWRGFSFPEIRVGAPPDDFSPTGQEWGFSPPKVERYLEDGYRLFAWEVRKNSVPGGALRLDHIMRFTRLFWIPSGKNPDQGGYVHYPEDDYLSILSLESRRNRTLIIGEDLGTLPTGLRETLAGKNIFSYRLFYFEKNEFGQLKDPQDFPDTALASISTHDLPTLAGFWAMEDILLRKSLGLLPEEEDQFHRILTDRIREKRGLIDRLTRMGFLSSEARLALHSQWKAEVTDDLHQAVLSYIMSTRAKLAVVSLEDLWLEKRQLNLPGTVGEYPNWKQKASYSLEEFATHPWILSKVSLFRELVDRCGRWRGKGSTPAEGRGDNS